MQHTWHQNSVLTEYLRESMKTNWTNLVSSIMHSPACVLHSKCNMGVRCIKTGHRMTVDGVECLWLLFLGVQKVHSLFHSQGCQWALLSPTRHQNKALHLPSQWDYRWTQREIIIWSWTFTHLNLIHYTCICNFAWINSLCNEIFYSVIYYILYYTYNHVKMLFLTKLWIL